MSSFQTWGPHLAIIGCAAAAWRFLGIHAFSRLAVAATLCLIFVGGTVTSNNAGLAVPDWPLSFGTVNPEGWWKIPNIFFEHGHRLFAQFVGLLTTLLAIRLWRTEERAWMRWLGVGAFAGVCIQGILGGLRVTHLSITLAMIHACTAQAFLCLLIFISAGLSPAWKKPRVEPLELGGVRWFAWLFVGAVYCQLVLGAVMRHLSRQSGAGLAFHDFPKADGKWIPALDTVPKLIHFLHRADGLFIACIGLLLLLVILATARATPRFVLPGLSLTVLIGFQIFLAAQVIWLDRPPFATSLHVVTGAAILGTGFLIAVRASQPVPPAIHSGDRLFRESVLTT